MPIFSEQLHFSAKGSHNQTEDWWCLCYDSDVAEFYVEHEWDHMDPYNIGKQPSDSGKVRIAIEGYTGPGHEKIDRAMQSLLQQANA